MCGIAGFVGEECTARPEAGAVLDRMCRVITHRGPDDQGVMIGEGVALGMRRLSIIDLAGGHQPISNEDGTVTVVFNGEIYNYRELQRELESLGHRYQTRSDTESIVHAYEEYGAGCVDHFRGMFAFAIWDARLRRLFIARDRVGIKPLYYTVTEQGTFVFGSEIKALIEHPEVKREVEPEAVDAYLTFGYVPDPLCIFRGIRKLPPGHHLTFDEKGVFIKQYWDFTYEEAEAKSEQEYLEQLRALLDEAVRIRLIADVPLGAFLSGGIDSSTVVGLMSRAATRPVKTFSIGFHEESFNELGYARKVAAHFGTDHHELIVTPDLCNLVDELAWHLDEPFADPSTIPTYLVSKLARQYVTVALSGDGGDELFAGYTRYVTDRNRSGFGKLPRFVRQVIQPLSRRLPHGVWGRNYLYSVMLDPLDRYIDSVSVFTGLNKPHLYTEGFYRQAKLGAAAAQFREYAARARTGEPIDALLYLDSKTYLPGDILTKVDRMSMAVSLEARVPLLDHKLIELVTTIPAPLKLKGLETKYIFKRAVGELVPAEILNRPKQGFGMPLQKWINGEFSERIRDTLSEPRTRSRGYLEQSYIALLLDEHWRGRRDHSYALWMLLMLELWHRTFIDGAEVETRAA